MIQFGFMHFSMDRFFLIFRWKLGTNSIFFGFSSLWSNIYFYFFIFYCYCDRMNAARSATPLSATEQTPQRVLRCFMRSTERHKGFYALSFSLCVADLLLYFKKCFFSMKSIRFDRNIRFPIRNYDSNALEPLLSFYRFSVEQKYFFSRKISCSLVYKRQSSQLAGEKLIKEAFLCFPD